MTREDAISREWLKTAIHNFYYGLKHTPTEEDIQAYIAAAPSVSTEKTGRWIKRESNVVFGRPYIYQCSVCKAVVDNQYETKYCPNCGCRMMEVEE